MRCCEDRNNPFHAESSPTPATDGYNSLTSANANHCQHCRYRTATIHSTFGRNPFRGRSGCNALTWGFGNFAHPRAKSLPKTPFGAWLRLSVIDSACREASRIGRGRATPSYDGMSGAA